MLSGKDPCSLVMKAVERQLADAKVLVETTLERAKDELRERFLGADGASTLLDQLSEFVACELMDEGTGKLRAMRLEARKAGRTTWEALERSLGAGAEPAIKAGVEVVQQVIDRLDTIVQGARKTLDASEKLKGKLQSVLKVRRERG